MGQGQGRHPAHVVGSGLLPPLPAGESGGGPGHHQVGPQPLGAELGAQGADRGEQVVGDLGGTGAGQLLGQGALLARPPLGEAGGVGVEGEAPAHRLGSLGGVGAGGHVDGQPEAVEQLGAQLALLGVHGADEDEAGRVLVGDALALHPVDPGGGHVEQHVDQMVGQQVDLVDVEHAAVGASQQPRLEAPALAGQGGAQVERADQAVLAGAQRQLRERRLARQQHGQPPGQRGLGRPLLPPQQHPPDPPINRRQHQRQLHLLHPHHRREREQPAPFHRRGIGPARHHAALLEAVSLGGVAVPTASEQSERSRPGGTEGRGPRTPEAPLAPEAARGRGPAP